MVSCSQLSVIPGGQQRNKPRLILRCARGQPKHITVCNQTIFLLHSGVGNISIQGQQSARPLFNFCVAIGKRYATGAAMLITRQLDEFCGRVGGGVEQGIIHTIRMLIYKHPAITGTRRVKISRLLGKIPLCPVKRTGRLREFCQPGSTGGRLGSPLSQCGDERSSGEWGQIRAACPSV